MAQDPKPDATDDKKAKKEGIGKIETAAWIEPKREAPPANTFELGLVMAGAVSAGAYTAGVIDYIVEALDTWEQAKKEGRKDVPQHSVKVRVVSGASAGAMTAAILAAHAYRQFPHVRPPGDDENENDQKTRQKLEKENPLFNAWVLRIDIKDLLKTGKGCGSLPPSSLFDGAILDEIVQEVLDSAGRVKKSADGEGKTEHEKTIDLRKKWLEYPTRFMLTVGNLRGTPYYQEFKGVAGVGYGMNTGRDYQTFALMPPWSPENRLPDEVPLMAGVVGSNLDTWKALGQWGLASGAFPVGLPPRLLCHRQQELRYRVVVESDEPPNPNKPDEKTYVAIPPSITWPNPLASAAGYDSRDCVYKFIAVDGGTLNNEPLNLARTVLAGGAGRNPRAGNEATRAVVLIDPFPEFEPPEPPEPGDTALWKVVLAMKDMWKGTARFNVEDLVLSDQKEVYSRFQIAPVRSSPSPKAKSLACGVLGGFGGFLKEEYRRHDYYLGRRNAQRMLRQYLVLPEDNGLFNYSKSEKDKKELDPALVADRKKKIEQDKKLEQDRDCSEVHYTADYNENRQYFSIIPIVPPDPDKPTGDGETATPPDWLGRTVKDEEPEPTWPEPGLVQDYGLSLLFAERLSEVAKCGLKTSDLSGFRVFALSLLAGHVVKSKVRPMIQKYLKDALEGWGL